MEFVCLFVGWLTSAIVTIAQRRVNIVFTIHSIRSNGVEN
jgi:hypothetical protein